MNRALRLALAVLAIATLGACAGAPLGSHRYLVIGVGVVRVDRADKAVGVSSRMLGLTLGCNQLTLGVLAAYCAELPIDGDVAIIERGAGPDQHLALKHLHKEKTP